jgi:hypothetical protein
VVPDSRVETNGDAQYVRLSQQANWEKYVAVHGDEALFKGDIQDLRVALNEAAYDPSAVGAASLPTKLVVVQTDLEKALASSCRTGRPMTPGALYNFYMPWRRTMKLLLQLDTTNTVDAENHMAVLIYLMTLWDNAQSDWMFAFCHIPVPAMPGYQQVYLRAASIQSRTMQPDGSTRPGSRPKGNEEASWKGGSTWSAHGGNSSWLKKRR